jgi:hypothetical protein
MDGGLGHHESLQRVATLCSCAIDGLQGMPDSANYTAGGRIQSWKTAQGELTPPGGDSSTKGDFWAAVWTILLRKIEPVSGEFPLVLQTPLNELAMR